MERGQNATGSGVVAALEAAWGAIRARHPELPEVVMITGSGLSMAGLKWGHFCPDSWANGRFRVNTQGVVERDRKPELFVSGERLGCGAVDTLQTLLHEAAHGLGVIRGVKTTSRQNRYHNQRFVKIADELGLTFEGDPHPTLGFSGVTITEETKASYADVLKALQAAITLTLDMPAWARAAAGQAPGTDTGHGVTGTRVRGSGTASNRNGVKLVCQCDKPRVIRVAAAVLELGDITCRVCDEDFSPES